ncbi:ABC transporter ATP-binding protein [Paenibacillus silvae]|uniref:ABC transporter ATP-binding protein n=1 Tax=Paenibacillus TaxID=44249 RepID=UPI001C11A690|nr:MULTISPECIES: ATP-binding cassette domain-containing protein [Paenibacillus]MBU5355190.1 ATP-binding cassette domain-containing protein [Paenibacillus barcinonensis]MDM5280488.1 ATP-binding cassette domain-containing protein [Paenibacillus silvae]
MTDTVASIQNLSKVIKGHTILNDVSLELMSGKIYGIVGRNGSGKSMLFKSIAGLIKPTSGTIEVFGDKITSGKFPKDTAILLDKGGFLPHYSGFKNLQLLASINNLIEDANIKKTLQIVGLDPEDKRTVKKYSLGMTQRLGIAQAIMENPQLLILDEPMNGLDEEGVQEMYNLILRLKTKGVTILLSSHNSEDIDRLCDIVYKMDKGSVTQMLAEKVEF